MSNSQFRKSADSRDIGPAEQGLARSYLAEQYEACAAVLAAQPALCRRFLEAQGRRLAEALVQRMPSASFALPDEVLPAGPGAEGSAFLPVPPELRQQHVGGLAGRLSAGHLAPAVRLRLQELEHSTEPGVALAARLTRYATAWHMIHRMLPDGRPVTYMPEDGDEIPTMPTGMQPGAALMAPGDAMVAEDAPGDQGAALQAPYVPHARRFFLPQWVICDDADRLLVNTQEEAEAHLAAMQRYLAVLHTAAGLAPYFVTDPEYRRKRYGMLGQLVNQARAFARYETSEIIRLIQARAWANDLNRGLRLSVPYFDDQGLQMRMHDFTVIPAGRIMFIPAFVVRAARDEQAKVAQDTRLSSSTRRHLLAQLRLLERAFGRVPHGWRSPAVKTR